MTRGEVWQVDLGLAAKIRPALILSRPPRDNDRALVTLVPHTTAVRGAADAAAPAASGLLTRDGAGGSGATRSPRAGGPEAPQLKKFTRDRGHPTALRYP
jgi:mRNA-degrading endonuclease toxin of MazEF toxin-antitoxin module